MVDVESRESQSFVAFTMHNSLADFFDMQPLGNDLMALAMFKFLFLKCGPL